MLEIVVGICMIGICLFELSEFFSYFSTKPKNVNWITVNPYCDLDDFCYSVEDIPNQCLLILPICLSILLIVCGFCK